ASICLSLPAQPIARDRPATPVFLPAWAWIGRLRPARRFSWALASQRRGRRFKSDHLHPDGLEISRRKRRDISFSGGLSTMRCARVHHSGTTECGHGAPRRPLPYPNRYPPSRSMSGELLTRARRRAGLSKAELARRSATSRPTVSAYEHGTKSPSLDTA